MGNAAALTAGNRMPARVARMQIDREALLACSATPGRLVTIAIAGVIAQSAQRPAPYDVPIYGLAEPAWQALLARHFPHWRSPPPLRQDMGTASDSMPLCAMGCTHDDARPGATFDEYADLVELFAEHCQPSADDDTDADAAALHRALATACMGANHLWQDMGLPSRAHLSRLLAEYYPRLVERNAEDMKWKKFLYRMLCDRAEVSLCKAPSCDVCSDRPLCFGPEAAC
ncbi:MAG: hypothetical protein IOMNBAOH_01623 [Rhodocyclaceae bacterium]|nr:nitrogen fixation protein NifQ [Rhodocyclaceae bacterium]MCG3187038.1 hypothetical protein [Rhodocyclaceae bacterium]